MLSSKMFFLEDNIWFVGTIWPEYNNQIWLEHNDEHEHEHEYGDASRGWVEHVDEHQAEGDKKDNPGQALNHDGGHDHTGHLVWTIETIKSIKVRKSTWQARYPEGQRKKPKTLSRTWVFTKLLLKKSTVVVVVA